MAVFIDVVESQAAIRYFATIGHRVPIHATASGRALLLQYSQEERDSVYRKIEFKQYGPSTPISIEAVEIELRNSIARGYCQSFADYSRDLAGAAIPLPIGDRRLSVVVAGPEFRIGPKVRGGGRADRTDRRPAAAEDDRGLKPEPHSSP